MTGETLLPCPTLREANVSRQAEWDPSDKITLAYRGNELAGEIGEACNVIKKLERERLGIDGSRDTIEHLAEELADGVICLDLIAMQAGIDLEAAVEAKFNATSKKIGLATRFVRATRIPDSDVAAELRAEIERLRSAVAWVEEVYPARTQDGGANVQMTWEQFNEMRACLGLPARKPHGAARPPVGFARRALSAGEEATNAD